MSDPRRLMVRAAQRALCVAAMASSIAGADPSSVAAAEITQLLNRVGTSHCAFYRNGLWYEADQAEAHLRRKWQYAAARARVRTTEEFIEQIGSKSSFSSQPYRVRCGADATMSAEAWLFGELRAIRGCAHESDRCTARAADQATGPP